MLLTMHPPTREMRLEAANAGEWTPDGWDRAFPRIQIVTVEEAFAGKRINYPGVAERIGGRDTTLKAAPKETVLTLPGISAPTSDRKRRKR
ncbi:MAG: hypothetical protein EXR72_17990 [Myxococcales bacterium]|nr:hypothetical protein [Myxococcales bacterium]